MCEHIVIFKWKPDADPQSIEAAKEGLRGLKERIPGIVDLSIGDNFSERSQGFHCGLVIRFSDRASLEAYGPHPAHQEVVQTLLAPIRIETIVVDYEIE